MIIVKFDIPKVDTHVQDLKINRNCLCLIGLL